MPRELEPDRKVAVYLFGEMCSHSDAGDSREDLVTWYEDGLNFYSDILDQEETRVGGVAV